MLLEVINFTDEVSPDIIDLTKNDNSVIIVLDEEPSTIITTPIY